MFPRLPRSGLQPTHRWLATVCLLIATTAGGGCFSSSQPTDDDSAAAPAADSLASTDSTAATAGATAAAATAQQPETAVGQAAPPRSLTEPQAGDPAPLPPPSRLDSEQMGQALFGNLEAPGLPSDPATSDPPAAAATDAQIAMNHGAHAVPPPLQLPPDLPPARLVEFLRSADQQMQDVASGRRPQADQAAATAEMTRLSQLKRQAASQLIERSTAGSADHVIGLRAQLQSLSHLAALGDLPAAEELERLALQQAASEDPALALDSRLVLIGLAMERLRNGVTADSTELLALVDQVAQAPHSPDVSALMVMGQALAMLKQYGDAAAAEHVRQVIVELFVHHPNPQVASLASGFVVQPLFAEAEAALNDFFQGEPLPLEQWRAIVQRLLEQSPDRAAVQFLASAALQFEAAGQTPWVDATYQLADQCEQLSQDARDELTLAVEARQTRQNLVGQTFQFDGPSVDGRPLSMTSYTGSVVLMPFWAISLPESLLLMQQLEKIRQEAASQVAIVGMNLDTADAPAAEFLQQSPVAFRSFHSPTGEAGGNPTARRFGVVSMPFVLVIDQQGQIVAVSLTGQGLEATVRELLTP